MKYGKAWRLSSSFSIAFLLPNSFKEKAFSHTTNRSMGPHLHWPFQNPSPVSMFLPVLLVVVRYVWLKLEVLAVALAVALDTLLERKNLLKTLLLLDLVIALILH